MRHQRHLDKDSYTKLGIAAAWPGGGEAQAAARAERDDAAEAARPALAATPSAPDVPAAVGTLIAASYAILLGTFALATVASTHSIFMIVIGAVFMVAFFSVPWLFLRQERAVGPRPSLDRFLQDGIDTFTGHSGGGAALVQILIVPVFLTLGVLCMGIAAAIIM